MKQYKEYKDSGVKWIGKIPSHWGIESFNRHFSYGKGLLITKADLKENGVAVISYGQIHAKINTGTTLPEALTRRVDSSFLETNPEGLLKKNDFIFADTSEDIKGCGNCCFNDYDGLIFAGYHTVVARPNNLQYPKYYAYLIQSNAWKLQIQTLVNGVKVYSINKGILKKSSLLIPTITEQQSIVAYLDNKVSKIDNYIVAAEKKMTAVDELKQVTIADAVTHGINPNAPMKDSGIAWIGMVPEHWEIKTLRAYIRIYSEKNHAEKQLLSVTREQGVILRDVDSKEENHNFIPDDLSGYKLVRRGDFAINKMKSWQGSYGVSNYEGIVSPAYYVCKLEFEYKDFFNKSIRCKAYVPFFNQYSKGIRVDQWDLSPIALKNIPFFEPPISEQNEIVAYIDRKVAQIDKMKASELAQIEKLKEYKQRLISDVVTGKVKVTND